LRIFTRYILSEVLSHALIGGALFTFVIFMPNMGSILSLVVRESATLSNVGEIFLFTLPNTFTVTIPMAVLVGVLLGLSRLSADSEITAMRACGIGVWSFVRIVSIIALLGTGASLLNALYLAPKATAALLELEDSIKTSQASFEIQPRVFYEDFKNYVLYVQDVRAGAGASQWHRVFLADLSDPSDPKITTAEHATVVNGGDNTLRMRLRDGTQHDTPTGDPNQYTVSTFKESDVPMAIASQDDIRIGRADKPILAMANRELYRRAHEPDGKLYSIELNKRLALPASCLVLMLVGVPLGMSSRRGGKSAGFVVTILLVFLYYFLSSTGIALARQNKVWPVVGVWAVNVIFAVFGLLLLRQLSRRGGVTWFPALSGTVRDAFRGFFRFRCSAAVERIEASEEVQSFAVTVAGRHRSGRRSFPLILDNYVLRQFLSTFFLVLASFLVLMVIFTFFELLGDIIRNRTPLVTVGEYLINLVPNLIYTLTPLCTLVAVLATFGTLSRTSELTAMKATGISLYRVMVPVLVIAAIIGAALFAFDESYLPTANRRQEALRSVIKGKPAQTFLRPDQQWIFGRQEPGKPARIYYYEFFDSDRDRFANLSVFEFDPETFALSRRIFATSVHWEPGLHQWIFEGGWERTFQGDAMRDYHTFDVQTFPEIREDPSYFKKENRQSQEMSFGELDRYIHDLGQSGFDTMRLRVQLNRKLAYPLITLVMAMLAIPFALSMGRRGSLTGIAAAIGLAVAYWIVDGTFGAMGNVNMLPAFLAAWSPDLFFGLIGGYLLLRTPT
jgi:LPS export ABC transporter permease LptG/LPS export ABC transporter permease LptF